MRNLTHIRCLIHWKLISTVSQPIFLEFRKENSIIRISKCPKPLNFEKEIPSLGFSFLPPQTTIPSKVLHFWPPWAIIRPRFFTFVTFAIIPSQVQHSLGFLIPPQVFHVQVLSFFLLQVTYYSALGFSLKPKPQGLGYYSTLRTLWCQLEDTFQLIVTPQSMELVMVHLEVISQCFKKYRVKYKACYIFLLDTIQL